MILAVPDDALRNVVDELAAADGFRDGGWAVHVNGAAGLSVLDAAGGAGAHRLAVHPLQTFPTVEDAVHHLRGAGVAVTAEDAAGEEFGTVLAHDMGGVPFIVDDSSRPLYHAGAVFASNYLVAVSALAAELFAAAGIADPAAALAPLQRATLENIERLGPEAALTGPAVRGDVTTIGRNLEALRSTAPATVGPYLELCAVAVEMGVDSGRLAPDGARAVREVLDAWR